MDAAPSPRGENAPPHVRLNSGTANIVDETLSPSSATGPRPAKSSSSLYAQSAAAAESAELLLPPKVKSGRRFRDDDSPAQSPSPYSSRRSSWSSGSVGSRDSRYGPFASPFDDSRAPSRAGSDDDCQVNTQTVSEKYNIMPSAGLLLFPEDVEKDDWLHNPDPNEKDSRDCDIFSKRGLVNVGGLAFITLGILVLFIGYPVLTFVRRYIGTTYDSCAADPMCIDIDQPNLKNIRTGLVDPDTPDSAKTRTSHKGTKQVLVFSDEFNTDGRTFYDGDDAYFQAVDLWYGATQDLEWYDPDAITTENGTLNIRFDAFQNHDLNYRSGMLQSWNKMCFKGGYLEASISLPGAGDTSGFWPGFWAMGNLGRPGYLATTDGTWPYSYHHGCDVGITPNQSSPDGISWLPGMRLPACTCDDAEHPSPGKSRSAPEIDALEASVMYLDPPYGAAIGQVSQSYQLAPFDIWWRPNYDFVELYDESITTMNSYQGSVYQQALSGLTNLNNKWYNGKEYQTYGFEYSPGSDGYITWYVGQEATWTLDGRAIGPNGNVGQRTIPEEPMAVIVNFGLSNSFASLNWTGLGDLMPATMRIDYIRIYQDEDDELVTCDPPGFPTTEYISNHEKAYTNYNYTKWEKAGYDWPKNSFMNTCG